MKTPKAAAHARVPDLDGITPRAVFVPFHPERRNVVAREALTDRIHSEFREMRGLSLTVNQAARLFGISQAACARILLGLSRQGLLRLRADGRYLLRGEHP
jgi:hypothetical protein